LNETFWQRNGWHYSDENKSLDDRLNMVFVNLTIGAGLIEQAAGDLGEAVQPEAAARSG
jgi:hypothetical protein